MHTDFSETWAVNNNVSDKMISSFASSQNKLNQDIENKINNMFTEISTVDSSYWDKATYKPYNPDSIYQKRGNYDLFDEMREDDQIAAVLTIKKLINSA